MVNSGAKVLQKNGICKFWRRKMEENVNFVYKKTIYKKNNPPCLTDCFWKNLYCCLIEINDSKRFTTIVLLLRAFIFAVRPGVRI